MSDRDSNVRSDIAVDMVLVTLEFGTMQLDHYCTLRFFYCSRIVINDSARSINSSGDDGTVRQTGDSNVPDLICQLVS